MTEQQPQVSRWLVIDIGCLECGNPSEVLGTYPSQEDARAAHPEAQLASDMDSHDWRGGGVLVIFDLGQPAVPRD